MFFKLLLSQSGFFPQPARGADRRKDPMQSKESRKELVRQFKELKPQAGVYAVRCVPSGRAWVGTSRNLGATNNGLWFGLRAGLHRETSLQAEWNAQGEQAFEYEALEVLSEDVHPMNIFGLLKEMKSSWVARLNAQPLL
jgi:hypothetical protein